MDVRKAHKTTPAPSPISEPLPEAERNARIYAGEILVFRGFAAVGALVDRLQAHCRELLGDDPQRVHERMPPAEIERAADALRKTVLADRTVAERLNDAFRSIGVALDSTYGDGLKQRVQPPARRDDTSHQLAPLGAHRDTWGSNIAAQTNWWAPAFPITARRTMALFPAYFAHAVPNNSAGWDFAELVRRLKTQDSDTDYPLLPLASSPPPWSEALPITIAPGDLLCFSGAHLHASVPNTTELTRLSFETRTVNAADVAAHRGAPTVDGRAVRTTYQWFRQLTGDRNKLGRMALHRSNQSANEGE